MSKHTLSHTPIGPLVFNGIHYVPASELANAPDARLIAAAPNLLEACKLALSYCEAGAVECAPGESLGDTLRDAIAKAEAT